MACSDPWFVWTDFGGVLTPPVSSSFAAFCQKFGLDQADVFQAMGKVAKHYGVSDPLELLDRPLIPESEWIDALNKNMTGNIPLTTLADVWFDGRETNEAWVQTLLDVRSYGVRVGMLSNMVPAWDDHWREMIDPDALFEHIVLSFEEGFRKPEPGLFAAAARKAGVRANRCVLVDDIEANCAGAINEGWQAVHFVNAMAAKDQLMDILRN